MMYVELNKADYDFICAKAPSFAIEYEGNEPVTKGNTVLFPAKSDEDISKFETALNFAIVKDGMNNQEEVNEVGVKLYEIYDGFEIIEE